MNRLAALMRPLPAFAATSLLAVAVGATACALSGVPAAVWGRNLAAWVAGALAAGALARWAGGAGVLRAVVLLAPLGVAASLLGEGQLGVRRWLELGPLQINAAMLLAPPFVVALGVIAPQAVWAWAAALVTLGVLTLQPDASQASALALVVCGVASSARGQPARLRWGLALTALGLAALAWIRADPLSPVAEVEEVVRLAGRVSPALAALAVAGLFAFAATPVFATRGIGAQPVRTAGLALGALFLGWVIAPVFGAFPVPLVGMGPGPILGAWLGIGLLAAVQKVSFPARS